MKYIHEIGYIHHDLKPKHILLVCNYKEDEKELSITNEFSVKVGDFFCKERYAIGNETNRKRKRNYILSFKVVKNCVQECPSDIWALGCIVLEMIIGQPPWDFTQPDIFQMIGYSINLSKISTKLFKDSKYFLRRCFVKKS